MSTIRDKVYTLSPRLATELWSAAFWQGPSHQDYTIHISIWISFSTPRGVYSHSHGIGRRSLQICPCRIERSNVVWSAAQGHKEPTNRQCIEYGPKSRSRVPHSEVIQSNVFSHWLSRYLYYLWLYYYHLIQDQNNHDSNGFAVWIIDNLW